MYIHLQIIESFCHFILQFNWIYCQLAKLWEISGGKCCAVEIPGHNSIAVPK